MGKARLDPDDPRVRAPRNRAARRQWCPLCGSRVSIHGRYPDHYWRKHADPDTGLECGQSQMYVLSPLEGGPR